MIKDNWVINVSLVDDFGSPMAKKDICIDVSLMVNGNPRYQFMLGVTDESGQFQFQRSHIDAALERHRELFLMDYNTPLSECDDVVCISSPGSNELRNRRAAISRWFPEREEELARLDRCARCSLRAMPVAVPLGRKRVDVQMVCRNVEST